MTTPYYQPYWIQSDEDKLEHYGVKGMKWGRKKTMQDLQSQSFLDTKLYETPEWIYMNAANFQLPSISEELGKVKSALQSAKKKLRKIAGKSTSSLKKETVTVGRGAIYGISKMMFRKIKSI